MAPKDTPGILLPHNWADPDRELFGTDTWVWTAENRRYFLTPKGPVLGTDTQFGLTATRLGRGAKWVTGGDGVLFGSDYKPIPDSSGHTVIVVAAPVSVASTKFAFGQNSGSPNKQLAKVGFNVNGAASAAAGSVALISYNGANQSVAASAGGIDGSPHCWVLANGTETGYIYRDGRPLTLTTNTRLSGTTAFDDAQQVYVGSANNSFTGMTDPLLLVAVIPRVISPARAAYISRVLSQSLAPAFRRRKVFAAAVAAGGFVATATDALSLADSAVSFTERLAAANDTLAITDSAVSVTERISEAIDALALADTAAASISTSVAASDTLTLADSALALSNISSDGQDALSLSDGAESSTSRTADAVDAIALSESATSIVDLLVAATDALTMADSAQSLVGGASAASDTIALADSAESLVSMIVSASDGVSLSDVAVALSEWMASASDSVGLTDSAAASIAGPGVTAAVASDTIAFSDGAVAIGAQPPVPPALPIAAKLLGTESHKRRRVKYRPFFDAPSAEPEPPQDESATPPAPTLGVEKIVRDSVRDVLAAIARLPAPADDTRIELESELEPIAQSTRPEPLPAAPLIPQDPDLLYDNERRRAMLIALIMATAE